MAIIATAPVPAQSRLWNTGTYEFPHLGAFAATEAAELLDVSPFVAFFYGARIRSEADVTAVAATMPELSPEQIDAVERWCAQVAQMRVDQVADLWNVSHATAEIARDIMRENLAGARCHDCGTPLVCKRCKYPYWYCPRCGDPGHGGWVPEHPCSLGEVAR